MAQTLLVDLRLTPARLADDAAATTSRAPSTTAASPAWPGARPPNGHFKLLERLATEIADRLWAAHELAELRVSVRKRRRRSAAGRDGRRRTVTTGDDGALARVTVDPCRMTAAPARRAFLSLGANLGERAAVLRGAARGARRAARHAVVAASRLYETAPQDVTDQPPFLNQVVVPRHGPRTAGPAGRGAAHRRRRRARAATRAVWSAHPRCRYTPLSRCGERRPGAHAATPAAVAAGLCARAARRSSGRSRVTCRSSMSPGSPPSCRRKQAVRPYAGGVSDEHRPHHPARAPRLPAPGARVTAVPRPYIASRTAAAAARRSSTCSCWAAASPGSRPPSPRRAAGASACSPRPSLERHHDLPRPGRHRRGPRRIRLARAALPGHGRTPAPACATSEAVRVLVNEGPDRVRELMEICPRFDRQDGEIVLGREGAHSVRRVLHAGGDATGREVVEHAVRGGPRWAAACSSTRDEFVIDLLTIDGRCIGALSLNLARRRVHAEPGDGHHPRHRAAPARSTHAPRTPRSPPATASPWPTAPAPPSATSSSCSSTPPAWRRRPRRRRSSPRRCAARARSCATPPASAS